jgi:rhamnosyltransferase subunit B
MTKTGGNKTGGKKIILATIGSLGDLHPFIALGLELKARGHRPVLAVPKSNVEKVEAAGLEAAPIFPTFQEIGAMLGMSEEVATRRMFRDPDFLIRRLMLHYLPASTEALDKLSEDASGIVSTMFAFASAIVAEKRRIPLIDAVLQPFSMMSPLDPPHSPDFWMLAPPPITPAKAAWNRMEMAIIRAELRRRYNTRINRVRSAYGLPPLRRAPIFAGPNPQAPLVLGMWSEALAPRPADYPPNTVITGFPVFDSDTGAPETLDPQLDAFMGTGEPPIVFTLGSFAVYAPGDFYGASLAIAERLKRRAVLLTGPQVRLPSTASAIVRAYAPHSLVFPRAALIVHHGGVGTTGQVMRAGKPHLIMPHMGDQFDHGHRITRAGLGAMVSARRYAAEGEAAIARLLADSTIARRAEEIAVKVRAENGAETAANAIELALAA